MSAREGTPRQPWHRSVALLLGAGAGVVALVLFAKTPGWPKIWVVLSNSAHAPAFGALALIAVVLLRRTAGPSPAALIPAAFVLTVLAGIAVEWLQGLIGRDSEWADVGTDALGAACALGFAGWLPVAGLARLSSRTGRNVALGTALLSGVLILYPIAEAGLAYARRAQQFPVIVQFDSKLDRYFTRTQSATGTTGPLPPRWARPGDGDSLRIAGTGGMWPGLAASEPQPDWRGYAVLLVDITNPTEEPLQLTVRVHDVNHDQRAQDRFNRTFMVAPGMRKTLSVPVADIASGPANRALDLEHVAGVIVYASDAKAATDRVYYLTRLWLE